MQTNIIEKIRNIVISAGDIILSADDMEGSVKEKGNASNLVTEYDLKVQNFVISEVKALLPRAEFLAEEEGCGCSESLKADLCFILDPIDGTANFVHGYRHSCISLAILERGVVSYGMVYDPYQKEFFYAAKGKGAYLNGRRIGVSSTDIAHSIITIGTTPYTKDKNGEITFAITKELFFISGDIRRSGSAALDLAYVAAGRTDGFFEYSLSPWDYAAGGLLVSEAGGIATDLDGKPMSLSTPSMTIAGPFPIYEHILRIVKSHTK